MQSEASECKGFVQFSVRRRGRTSAGNVEGNLDLKENHPNPLDLQDSQKSHPQNIFTMSYIYIDANHVMQIRVPVPFCTKWPSLEYTQNLLKSGQVMNLYLNHNRLFQNLLIMSSLY